MLASATQAQTTGYRLLQSAIAQAGEIARNNPGLEDDCESLRNASEGDLDPAAIVVILNNRVLRLRRLLPKKGKPGAIGELVKTMEQAIEQFRRHGSYKEFYRLVNEARTTLEPVVDENPVFAEPYAMLLRCAMHVYSIDPHMLGDLQEVIKTFGAFVTPKDPRIGRGVGLLSQACAAFEPTVRQILEDLRDSYPA